MLLDTSTTADTRVSMLTCRLTLALASPQEEEEESCDFVTSDDVTPGSACGFHIVGRFNGQNQSFLTELIGVYNAQFLSSPNFTGNVLNVLFY